MIFHVDSLSPASLASVLLLTSFAVIPASATFIPLLGGRQDANFCTTLSNALPGKVFLPLSVPYEESTNSYFAAFENEVNPNCVVQPANAEDVSTIVKLAAPGGIPGKVQLAVRGGGHTAWAGSANIEAGVTIDMRKINGIDHNTQTGLVKIGSGNKWGDVYSTLLPRGVTVSGGRVSKVGVAGLTTGGGLSYFSPERGFVADDVTNYEVVLASGRIVNANKSENSDLWVALKGGSNNFGIVTRFDMPSFPQTGMWGGLLLYPITAWPDLMRQFSTFARLGDKKSSIIMAAGFVNGGEQAVGNIYYTQPATAPAPLKPFVDLQPNPPIFNTLRNDTLLGFANEQSAFSTNGARQLYFTTGFRADADLMIAIKDLWSASARSIADVAGLSYTTVFQPITAEQIRASNAKSPNSLGLSPGDGPFVVNLINSVHTLAKDDQRVIDAALKLVKDVENLAASRGLSSRYRFLNYAFKGQKVLQGYGTASLMKMKITALMYDPFQFFQKAVPGGFKLKDV